MKKGRNIKNDAKHRKSIRGNRKKRIKNIRNEEDAWKYINKYRKKKSEGPSKDILDR